jgi:hypothetical protein
MRRQRLSELDASFEADDDLLTGLSRALRDRTFVGRQLA